MLVVPIRHRDSLGGQGGEEIALLSGDFTLATQKLDVRGADVGDEPDIGLGDFGESCDLAPMVHSHFDHRTLMSIFARHQGEGDAIVVVEVAAGLEAGSRGFEYRRGHLLGGGLSAAAGQADDRALESAAMSRRQITDATGRVRNRDHGQLGDITQLRFAICIDEQASRSGVRGLREILVGVVIGSHDCGEELPRCDAARIDRQPGQFVERRPLQHGATTPGRDVCGGVTRAHAVPPERNAVRASSRSSKGSFTLPTIW